MLLSKLLRYVLLTCSKYHIDESHGLIHSMNTLMYTHEIYNSEVLRYPYMKGQDNVAYVSAIVHDMCDKKYMNETHGMEEIQTYLQDDLTPDEMKMVKKIVSTMSYSKVKCDGFPDMGIWEKTYHCVREADLLGAYDFDRSLIYHMVHRNCNVPEAYKNACDLFETRVFRHRQDGLLLSEYARCKSVLLERDAVKRMNHWGKIIRRMKM